MKDDKVTLTLLIILFGFITLITIIAFIKN